MGLKAAEVHACVALTIEISGVVEYGWGKTVLLCAETKSYNQWRK